MTCVTRDGQLTAEVSLGHLSRLLDTVTWWSDAERLALAAAIGFGEYKTSSFHGITSGPCFSFSCSLIDYVRMIL